MKTRIILSLLFLLPLLTSCVYMDIKTPLDKNVNNTVLGPKRGESKAHSILWLYAWGDAGASAAARAGGIEKITHLDSGYELYLFGLYSTRTTIAYGE